MTYSFDLQIRTAYLYKHNNNSLRKIANELLISKSSLSRWCKKYSDILDDKNKIKNYHN